MNYSNILIELLLLFALVKSSVPDPNLPNSLTLLLELVNNNLYDVLNYNEPLFLSPYIESGEIETGRSLSRVDQLPNVPNVPSYSGFFTVNQEYNSNLFFWFFPALNNNPQAPVILWLQGGPGTSGLMGLFVEHGPYVLYSNTTADLRGHTWAKEFHVLYVDNPVGTGFSFTDNEKGYDTNQDQITDNLYEFLKQFFEVYYEYSHNDFYICGESYGGKHVLNLGYKLHIDGPPAGINFKGISIGNPFIDFQYLSNLSDYYHQLGILDYNQASIINDSFKSVLQDLQKGNYSQALDEYNRCYGYSKDSSAPNASYITDFSGYKFYYNFLLTERPKDYSYYTSYVQSQLTRNAIHVGSLPFHGNQLVMHNLWFDAISSSSSNKLASLMDSYKVLVYSGQLDLLVPYVSTEELLRDLTWKYKAAERMIWRLESDNTVAGYVRSVGSVFVVLVRNAGQVVPRDQPESAIDLITKFIKDIPYSNKNIF